MVSDGRLFRFSMFLNAIGVTLLDVGLTWIKWGRENNPNGATAGGISASSREGKELKKETGGTRAGNVEAWVSDIVHQEGNLNRIDLLLAARDVSTPPAGGESGQLSPQRFRRCVWSTHRLIAKKYIVVGACQQVCPV